MNSATKRANTVVPLHQRIEVLNEAAPPGSGHVTARALGWRGFLGRLTAGVRARWAGKGSSDSLPPGRDLKQMVRTYGSGDEPVQDEVTPCTKTHGDVRRHDGDRGLTTV